VKGEFMGDGSDLYWQARRDAVTMCGFADVAELTPAMALKVDLIASLRICIDNVSARLISGVDDRQDLGKLIGACEALTKLLPATSASDTAPPDPPSLEASAREKMQRLLDSVAAAREFEEAREVELLRIEVERLTAENTQLRAARSAAEPKLLPPPAKSVPAITESAEVPRNYQRGPPEPWRGHVGDAPGGSGLFTRRASWDR
jgi:hypothetical protein